MKNHPILPLLALAAAIFATASAPAAQDTRFPDLERRFPGTLTARSLGRGASGFELVGSTRISGSIPDAAGSRTVALGAIETVRDHLEASPSDLVEVGLVELAGTYALRYEQRLDGLPVVGSRVDVRLTREGDLTILRATGLVRGPLAGRYAVAQGDAGELARVSVTGARFDRLWAHSARQVGWRGASSSEARRAWQIEVSDPAQPAGSWLVTLDGESGVTLDVAPRFLAGVGGTVDGRGTASGVHGVAAPAVLPMANLHVASIDPAVAIVKLTQNGCREDQAVISSGGTKVAYVSGCDGDREICVVASDGTGFLQLTHNGADDHSPVISADGSRVAFVSNVDGDEEIYTVLTNGTGLLKLTSNTAADRAPSISANGLRVVYESDLGGDLEIFRVETSGTAPVQLTTNTTADWEPSISADGSRLAWVSDADGDAEIFVRDWSGGSAVQLTMNSVQDLEPDFAADGSIVVFGSRLPEASPAATDPSVGGSATGIPNRPPGAGRVRLAPEEIDLFQVASDGSDLRRLTYGNGDERNPRFSGSGPRVVHSVTGTRDILLIDGASHGILRLSDSAASLPRPSIADDWRDGVFIADDGDREVWAWHLGTSGAAAITSTDSAGNYSLGLPDGDGASLFLRLTGAWADVQDLHPAASRLSASGSATAPAVLDMHFNPTGDAEYSTSQVTAYRHTTKAHDDLSAILRRPPLSFTGPLPFDEPIEARVNFPDPVANAFYNLERQDMTFFMGAGASRPNTAYDSVIYHEYGHFLDDAVGGIGTISSCESAFGLSEGIGDVVASYLTGSPMVGAGFFGPGTAVRDYSTFPWVGGVTGAKGRQYDCLDCATAEGKPEPHQHGQAFAGFAWDLRADLGTPLAEDLVFGALMTNPGSMQIAVTEVFILASTLYGGSPATSPFYDSICTAAARHGFDCVPRGDWGTLGCTYGVCSGPVAIHRTTGTEWLGPTVDWESACEPYPNSDDDGVVIPPAMFSGTTTMVSVTLKVNPALKGSGRYGAPTGPQLIQRRLYLNAWLFLSEGGGVISSVKVLGTGSDNPVTGPDSFETTGGGGLLNAVAFNPDTWAGDSYVFTFPLTVPTVPVDRSGVVRFRLDWGEDAGRIDTCLTDPMYSGACGPARFGEVEDYQMWVLVP